MKAFLMYPDRDFDLDAALPWNKEVLTQDLELDTLFNSMAQGDPFLLAVARAAALSSVSDPEVITYRQDVLRDALAQDSVVRQIYGIALEALQREKRIFDWAPTPDRVLHRSIEVLELFVGLLKRLRRIAEEHGTDFRSEGFTRFFGMLIAELDDDYFLTVEDHLRTLRFRNGVLLSARLGMGNKGTEYVLRQPRRTKQSWYKRISMMKRSAHTLTIADRDESGFAALSELKDRGVNLVADALARSTDHILSFFSMLRRELAFYVGSLNLHSQLVEKGEPTCFPIPVAAGEFALSCQGLYDACLTLIAGERVVGNDVAANKMSLVMITGANQGGKSTFLRSLGLAQLMMQCGMFVPAEEFRANVCAGVFTHFKREEDATMSSGKLDEELGRMSELADVITPNSILLFNESFASTNEREGSEIARQIVHALLDMGLKVFFVTHLFDLAHGFLLERLDNALFLRADREPEGRRTFKLVEGEPLPTSYGEDLYRRIFGTGAEGSAAQGTQ